MIVDRFPGVLAFLAMEKLQVVIFVPTPGRLSWPNYQDTTVWIVTSHEVIPGTITWFDFIMIHSSSSTGVLQMEHNFHGLLLPHLTHNGRKKLNGSIILHHHRSTLLICSRRTLLGSQYDS